MTKKALHLAMWMIVLVLASAIPVGAADVIYAGIDPWLTRADGRTYVDFAQEPIPAGFFCFYSAPFAGRIVFKGVPLATGHPGELGATDTIIERLDDAVFNKRGVAVTRVRVRALSFESLAPVKTACGLFKAQVSLDGEQPTVRMRIIRENELGGRFLAPVALKVKIVFTPVGRVATEALELRKSIQFQADRNARWATQPGAGAVQHAGFVSVDTNGDRVPDTFVPGTSNFAAGWTRPKATAPATTAEACHGDGSCVHCAAN